MDNRKIAEQLTDNLRRQLNNLTFENARLSQLQTMQNTGSCIRPVPAWFQNNIFQGGIKND